MEEDRGSRHEGGERVHYQVLALFYDRGMRLAEVGKAMGLTESRICQIRQEAIATLRKQIMRARSR